MPVAVRPQREIMDLAHDGLPIVCGTTEYVLAGALIPIPPRRREEPIPLTKQEQRHAFGD